MKRITNKAWFGKRIIGWGYRPVSTEGWLVTIAMLFAVFIDLNYYRETITGYAIIFVILIIYHFIIFLTGDAPGSEALDKLRNKK
jgi:hypothetical protein